MTWWEAFCISVQLFKSTSLAVVITVFNNNGTGALSSGWCGVLRPSLHAAIASYNTSELTIFIRHISLSTCNTKGGCLHLSEKLQYASLKPSCICQKAIHGKILKSMLFSISNQHFISLYLYSLLFDS